MAFWYLLRPRHWTKNIFVFGALIFGRKLFGPDAAILPALQAFVAFCLASSAVYILNDLLDVEADRRHPTKRQRPLAAGQVSPGLAGLLLLFCGGLALALAGWLSLELLTTLAAYMGLMAAYSLGLKRVLILDCMIIALGFCLRAVAGAVAVDVFVSPWMMICTFALCLFLAFGKRRGELSQLGSHAELFRETLGQYTPELLAHMLNVTSGLAVVCFLLYAMDERTQALFGSNHLVYTTPMVLFCVFRFSALTQGGLYTGPVDLIWQDRPFQIGFSLWVVACLGLIYKELWVTWLF